MRVEASAFYLGGLDSSGWNPAERLTVALQVVALRHFDCVSVPARIRASRGDHFSSKRKRGKT
jgi:hypothetical protein